MRTVDKIRDKIRKLGVHEQRTKTVRPETRTGRPDKYPDFVRREWGDLPVVDATADLPVFVLPMDVAQAVRHNGECCVFANACRRSFGSSKVIFMLAYAYVDMPDQEGRRRIYRYKITKPMRQQIESFDKGRTIPTSGQFLLRKVPKRSTLEARARYARAYYKQQKTKGIDPGWRPRKGQHRHGITEPLIINLVRNGRGQMSVRTKFNPNPKKARGN